MNEKASPLFPELTPFATHMLPVGDGHTLYIEQSGNPSGIPVIMLHGGPGTGTSDKARRRFDPTLYHIIGFDQRGAGRSTPAGNLAGNTTAHLVADIETIRTNLGIGAWVVYGTSWGCTLALAYAQAHPQCVKGLIVGGVFLGSADELNWFNQPTGLPRFRWAEYANMLNVIPPEALQGKTLDRALLDILLGNDPHLARRAAEAYALYEGAACVPVPDLAMLKADMANDTTLVGHIAIELHYFANLCFLKPNQLLDGCHAIAHIPTFILQGALDMVCPPSTAYALHAAMPGSTLTIVPTAGHVADDAMESARIQATNTMAEILKS